MRQSARQVLIRAVGDRAVNPRVAGPGETLTIPGLPEVAISLTDLIG